MAVRFIKTPPLIILLTGTIFSFLIYALINAEEKANSRFQFESEAHSKIALIEDKIQDTKFILSSLKAFFDSSVYVHNDEFRSFTSKQSQRYPHIKTLEWAPKVTHKNREKYEKRTAKHHKLTNLTFKTNNNNNETSPSPQQTLYFPIHYINPYKDYEQRLGFDLFSQEESKETLMSSAMSGEITTTKALTITPKNSTSKPHKSILVTVPIFKKLGDLRAQDNLDNVKGFVLAMIDMTNLAEKTLASQHYLGLGFVIFDITQDLNNYDIIASHQVKEEDMFLQNPKGQHLDQSLSIGGRKWLIRIFKGEYHKVDKQYTSLLVLVVCLLLTAIIVFYSVNLRYIRPRKKRSDQPKGINAKLSKK
jgi:CHASE1-domain containing sensor protein